MSEVEIGVPPEDVWPALVETEVARPWYFNLKAVGEFRPGAEVHWQQPDGTDAEISTVAEVAAPRRLVLKTRFLFAPIFAELAPHTVTFELEPLAAGSRVSMRVDAPEGPVAKLFAGEGRGILLGLRVALDPAVQAELARLDDIGEVEIHDVTPDRVADYQDFFDNSAFRDFPAWQFCYCSETNFAFTQEESTGRTGADNRRDMSRLIEEGKVTSLLAYADGKPVAWCNYGPTTRLAGVMHKLKLDAGEHEGVGSVSCFVISAPYRRHGIAKRLLDTACERLRMRGLKAVEAYPANPNNNPQHNYRGPLAMYLEAGFDPWRELERYTIVRKQL